MKTRTVMKSTRRPLLTTAEQIAALSDAITLAQRPELDHLAVRLAELAVPPTPVHPADWSPPSFLRRWRYPTRLAESRAALDGLVASAERLPPRLLELIVALAPRELPGSIERAAGGRTTLARRSAIRLIERDSLWACAGSLHTALVSGDPAVARRAGHTLLTLALRARRSGLVRHRIEPLERACARGASEFESHRDRNAMLASLVLIDHREPEPGSAQEQLRGLLTREHWAGRSALLAAIRHNPLPELRASAWRWLSLPGVAGAALDRVARAETDEEHESVLVLAHLGLSARRLRALRTSIDRRRPTVTLAGLIPDARTTGRLSRAARLGRVRLVERLGLGAVYTRALLEGLEREPDPVVRLAGVRAEGAGVSRAWSHDPCARVALSAATARSLAGVPGSIAPPTRPSSVARLEALVALGESEHAPVRRIAHQDRARIEPWSAGTPASRLSARRWLAMDRVGFLQALRARLTRKATAVQGVLLARALALTPEIEDVIGLLVRDSDVRVCATGVSACADLTSDESLAWIDTALLHHDERVRANAIDARARRLPAGGDLMRADPAWHARLVELKDGAAHRERAGAVRTLLAPRVGAGEPERLYEPEGVASLERMLTDDRPGHRLSGVWVAGRVLTEGAGARLGPAWGGLAGRIAELTSDEDPGVRARARACCARLHAGLGEGAVA
ncbi:MAG: hypothetical protein ACF8Q5_08905 [Phycisphaerales bacterium JB040]